MKSARSMYNVLEMALLVRLSCTPSATLAWSAGPRRWRSGLGSTFLNSTVAFSKEEEVAWTCKVQFKRAATMSAYRNEDPRIPAIGAAIRAIPDFPKPGINFRDITTLLLDPKAFQDTVDLFVERYKGLKIDVVAAVEARGFIFGAPVALAIGAKFVPLRKPKKLPGEVIGEEYTLEYGSDRMEMHVGAVEAGERVVVIDDLIATGGTLGASIKLINRVGGKVVECACVIELNELKGREKLGDVPLFILVEYEGE